MPSLHELNISIENLTLPEGISDADYHAGDEFSQSFLKDSIDNGLARSLYERASRGTLPKEPTPAQLIGQATHCMVLQKAAFVSRYKMAPEDKTKKAELAPYETQARKEGKQLLTHVQFSSVKAMATSVLTSPAWVDLVSKPLWEVGNDCLIEQAAYAELVRGERKPLRIRGKADFVDCKRNIIVDLKTCTLLRGHTDYEATRHALRYGAHYQAAWYAMLYTNWLRETRSDSHLSGGSIELTTEELVEAGKVSANETPPEVFVVMVETTAPYEVWVKRAGVLCSLANTDMASRLERLIEQAQDIISARDENPNGEIDYRDHLPQKSWGGLPDGESF